VARLREPDHGSHSERLPGEAVEPALAPGWRLRELLRALEEKGIRSKDFVAITDTEISLFG
jgi:hypothetical protein